MAGHIYWLCLCIIITGPYKFICIIYIHNNYIHWYLVYTSPIFKIVFVYTHACTCWGVHTLAVYLLRCPLTRLARSMRAAYVLCWVCVAAPLPGTLAEGVVLNFEQGGHLHHQHISMRSQWAHNAVQCSSVILRHVVPALEHVRRHNYI